MFRSTLLLFVCLVVATSAPASPGEKVRQNRRDLKAEPADFEGPVAVELHEAFKSGAALVELELKAPQGTRCGELVVSVDRSGEKIEVKIEGVRRRGRSVALILCRGEAPRAPSAIVDLTSDVGHHDLVLTRKGSSDVFGLDISAERIAIQPSRTKSISILETEGTLLRAPFHSIWLTIHYRDKAARERFREQTNTLLHELEAVGAHHFKPNAGKYAPYGAWSALDPEPPPSKSFPPPVIDRYFFHYDGEFEPLVDIVERWKKYDRPYIDESPPDGYMSTHVAGWHGRWFNTSPQTVSDKAYRLGRRWEAEERSRRPVKSTKQSTPKESGGDSHGRNP
jgi:hypothetical protein